MKKAMKAMILVVLLAATSLTLAAAADDSSPIDGSWLITIQTANGPVNGVLTLTTEEGAVVGTLKSAAGEFRVVGGASAEGVRFYINSSNEKGSMVLSGPRTPGAFSGTVTQEDVELGSFAAERR